jgi:hypothetical protein
MMPAEPGGGKMPGEGEMQQFDAKEPEDVRKMRNMFGPGQVDQMIRSAIQTCWMMLPENRRTLEEVESEVRRIFERALKNMREDGSAFGMDGPSKLP